MARIQLKNYVFTPAGAGVGTVIIPGNYGSASILTILNATKQSFIYNFADSTLGATITWNSQPDTNFPTSIDGITTVTFTTSTSTMSSADKLAIYAEIPYQLQRPYATDAVERQRVAQPQSLIDADFEYGLQNTKWQSLFTNNDNPTIYEIPGSDVYPNVVSYVSFVGNSVATSASTGIILPNNVGNVAANWSQNDFALIVDPSKAGPPAVSYITSNVASLNQRAFTVASSTGFATNDNVIIINLPVTNNTTVAGSNLVAGTTTLTLTANNNITAGTLLMVQTVTANLWELMSVASITTTTATVVRNRFNTNSGNATIFAGSGAGIRVVGQVELGNVVSNDSASQITVNRAWMNTTPTDNLLSGCIVAKLNVETSGASGTNVEIVQMTTVGTAQGNIAVLSRGALGTTALSSISIGSPIIRLSGIFNAGSVNLPLVGINLKGHTFLANGAISTQNHTDPNTEGQYQVVNTYANYFTYYPRRSPGFNIGFPLNRWDSQIRYGGFYGTASLPPVTLSTDGATPSVITATAAYAHGLSPGTPVLVNINTAGGNGQYATGSFTILSVPTVSTFTFTAKSGAAVTGPITGLVYVRPSAFFTHRAADGGISLGSGTPHHGASAARQTKKYFRYQSGKGMMWTSGTLLGTNMDVVSITATGTGAGNTITIVSDVEHGFQVGANILISGIQTSGYNGYFPVLGITSDYTFTVNAASTLGSTTVQYGSNPKIAVQGWAGSSVRAGMFDSQNGVFWENTGYTINVVLRSATQQTTGTVSVEVATNLLTGDGYCVFTQQYVKGDKIVLRGMTHTVTSVIDDNTLTISPVWRGLTNQVRIKPTKVVERRYPQSQWNLDKLDGTGQSGYLLDPTKMQMLFIQYTWYGAGFIDYGLRGQNGNMIFCHRMLNNNINYEAFMRSGNLPARYEAINDTPVATLANAIPNGTDTIFYITDGTQFPTPSPAAPIYVQIDNEVLKCTGIVRGSTSSGVTPAQVNGITRGSSFSLWQDGANKTFSLAAATSHSANVGVGIISATSAPSLNHWGSAVILDGGFDTDRGYAYTYSTGNVNFPTGTNTITSFILRLAPAVSNQIPGDLGQRDLVNRAQLVLNNMTVNYTGTSARFLIEGILNPNNISTTGTTWSTLYNSPQSNPANPSGAVQPSFAQLAPNSAVSYTSLGYATGGERLFAIPVNTTNSGQLDLSMVKQIGNSGIPGYNIYPDGPELLCINITSLTTLGGSTQGDIQVAWTESQA